MDPRLTISRRGDRVPLDLTVRVKLYGTQSASKARLSDLSPVGCRIDFDEATSIRSCGIRLLIRLPGREYWPATVIWRKACSAGIEFERPLHPADVEKYARYLGGPQKAAVRLP